MKIRIGTRGSKLALWQAETVKSLLVQAGFEPELVLFQSEGDQNQSQALKDIGGIGLFTKVLDDALLRGDADIAVHSAKDMTSEVPEGLQLTAFLKREDPRDVLLSLDESVDLDNLNQPIRIGTSSQRRTALLRHYVPHAEVKNIRGNVDTRVRKMESGEYDALLLAYAGVKRMGFTHLIRRKLNVSSFTPATGQGAIAVVSKSGYAHHGAVHQALNHKTTEIAVTCERAYLRTLQGGCSTPAFALATVVGETVSLQAGIADPKGSLVLREQLDGPAAEAEAIGLEAGTRILQQERGRILHG